MRRCLFTLILIVSLVSIACSVSIGSPQSLRGSGTVVSETRTVGQFTEVEIAGSADVSVSFGETQSVVVEAEDNILPLIETNVRGSRLVIDTKSNMTINPTRPVRVTVTMKSLEAASVSGSGNLTINGLQTGSLKLDLAGSGNITATGQADTLDIKLDGSGNIMCRELHAKSATVRVDGSGNANVYASVSLEASVGGSGKVTYGGNPPTVNKSVQGSGSVDSLP